MAYEQIEDPTLLSEDDNIILFLGPVGSGKSNMIDLLAGRTNKDEQKAHTSQVEAVRVKNPFQRGNRAVLIDTPGFNDGTTPDLEVLQMIGDWIERAHLNPLGVLYFHRITDSRVDGAAQRTLDMLSQFCGASASKNLVFVTTMWDLPDPIRQNNRIEKILKTSYWKGMISQQARVARFLNNRQSAWKIINDSVLAKCQAHLPLQFQQELSSGVPFEMTRAALRLQGVDIEENVEEEASTASESVMPAMVELSQQTPAGQGVEYPEITNHPTLLEKSAAYESPLMATSSVDSTPESVPSTLPSTMDDDSHSATTVITVSPADEIASKPSDHEEFRSAVPDEDRIIPSSQESATEYTESESAPPSIRTPPPVKDEGISAVDAQVASSGQNVHHLHDGTPKQELESSPVVDEAATVHRVGDEEDGQDADAQTIDMELVADDVDTPTAQPSSMDNQRHDTVPGDAPIKPLVMESASPNAINVPQTSLHEGAPAPEPIEESVVQGSASVAPKTTEIDAEQKPEIVADSQPPTVPLTDKEAPPEPTTPVDYPLLATATSHRSQKSFLGKMRTFFCC
ncbi:hypothetical protein D9613_003464 [Agrocybe pediades]|uniref:G domain-containing protein n=1 Tax=Agrocybe pediades TaxID=84607 RepID=A0A8H4QNR2_9AGAR|nr:hypothetical protein D9613_003464 [Agrocybe pediades]